MNPGKILELLSNLMTKIASRFDLIADQFYTSPIDKTARQENQLIKDLIIDFITKYHIDEIYGNVPKELTYWVEEIVSSGNYDVKDYLDLFYKILELFGFKREKVEKLTLDEIVTLFHNVGILNNSRASVYQIQSLVKILNLEKFVSIGELELVYNEHLNDVYFYINWITKPIDDIKYLPYEYVYQKLPYLVLTKEDILNNIQKFTFPIKTNILYIHTKYFVLESLITHLGAALFATKFKNIKIKTYESAGNTYFVEILDIPLFVQYLLLKTLGSEYYSKNRQTEINNLLKFYELSSYLLENETLFDTIVSILYPFDKSGALDIKYSSVYDTKYVKLRQLLVQYVIEQTPQSQKSALLLDEVDDYLLTKYPKLIYELKNSIFQNTNLIYNDKKNKIFEIISNLSSNLIAYSTNIVNIKDRTIYQDNVFKFIQMFINIKPTDNVISNYVMDRVDVILTQIPIYVIPFIDYSQMLYVIRDLLQMVPMKDEININLDETTISSILYRESQTSHTENECSFRYYIISNSSPIEILNVKSTTQDIDDSYMSSIKASFISIEHFRYKLFNTLENIYKARYGILSNINVVNLKISNESIANIDESINNELEIPQLCYEIVRDKPLISLQNVYKSAYNTTISLISSSELESIKKSRLNIEELRKNEINSLYMHHEQIRDKNSDILQTKNCSRTVIRDIANTYVY